MKTLTNKKLFTAVLMMLVLSWITMSFNTRTQDDKKKPWKVAEAAKAKKNPIAKGAESTSAGKALYTKNCKSCHGSKGLGDGPKSKELDTPSGDFSTKDFQLQTDGELFYKIQTGRDDMPSFKKKITDEEDIWNIINYVRTL